MVRPPIRPISSPRASIAAIDLIRGRTTSVRRFKGRKQWWGGKPLAHFSPPPSRAAGAAAALLLSLLHFRQAKIKGPRSERYPCMLVPKHHGPPRRRVRLTHGLSRGSTGVPCPAAGACCGRISRRSSIRSSAGGVEVLGGWRRRASTHSDGDGGPPPTAMATRGLHPQRRRRDPLTPSGILGGRGVARRGSGRGAGRRIKGMYSS
jgi:hypothetical protein